MKRLPLILSLVLFVALCATSSFWVLQFIKPETRKVTAPPPNKPMADVESVAGLFGGALAVNTNYQLKGIILANPENQSGAIIAVDGKPTQAYRMEAEISPGVKLKEVHAEYILLSDNGINKRIDLPQDFKSSGQIVGAGDNTAPPRGRGMPIPAGNPNTGNAQEAPDNSILAGRNTRMRGLRPIPPAVPKNLNPQPEQTDNNPPNPPQPAQQ